MKFIVSSSALLKQLAALNGALASNPIVPILENFLFEIEDERLRVTASDLQITISSEVVVDADMSGSIAIPAKMLLETLRNLPEQPVTFKVDLETNGIEIVSENGRYKLSGESADDFPKIASVKEGKTIDLTAECLASAVSYTLFAISGDDMKPAMNGVYAQFRKDKVLFVSTDGHRLVRYNRTDIGSTETTVDTSIIIPKKALSLLKSTLPSEDTEVKVSFDKSHAFFHFNNVSMICRLIDERFPDYENVIPLNNSNILILDRLELLSSLKRMSIYANKFTNQIRLKLKKDDLQISAEDKDFENEATESLLCEFEGEDMEIGFNAKFLIESLSTLQSRKVKIQMSEPNRAALILPTDTDSSEEILMLVMPVMLNNYQYN
ncbi:MAG: DNA polymerase III subunit beta [Bacteroidetes bacterium]|nr:MAG: DNA polymerase III subunit beta [Bacteroidota bacterium]